jgi:hypothetical protein
MCRRDSTFRGKRGKVKSSQIYLLQCLVLCTNYEAAELNVGIYQGSTDGKSGAHDDVTCYAGYAKGARITDLGEDVRLIVPDGAPPT